MPNHNELESQVKELSNGLAGFGKGVGVIAAGLYVLGVITVNIHLGQFGFVEFSLVKLQYIFTGFLVAILPSTLAVTLAVVKTIRSSDPWWTKGGLLGISLVMIFLSGSVLVLFTPSTVAAIIIMVLALILVSGTYGSYELSGSEGFVRTTAISFTPMFACIFLYLILFAIIVYPRVPQQFGGGLPILVRLVVDDDYKGGLEELGMDFYSDGQLTRRQYGLIFEGRDVYILRDRGRNIRINKDIVKALDVIQLSAEDIYR